VGSRGGRAGGGLSIMVKELGKKESEELKGGAWYNTI